MKRVTKNGKAMLLADETFNRIDNEAWIIEQLGNPPSIRAGSTTFEIRQQRICALILERGISELPASAKTREKWSSVYKRFYGESLKSTQSKGKTDVPAQKTPVPHRRVDQW